MEIQKIQGTTFGSKTRYMTVKMQESVNDILHRMNAETTQSTFGDNVDLFITRRLVLGKKAIFEDERRLKTVRPYDEQMTGFSTLKMGNSKMEFYNETGEIVDYKKPFFKPWRLFIKQAEKTLKTFQENFNNSWVVGKDVLKLHDLTLKGNLKMRKFVLEFERERLAQIEKELKKIDEELDKECV